MYGDTHMQLRLDALQAVVVRLPRAHELAFMPQVYAWQVLRNYFFGGSQRVQLLGSALTLPRSCMVDMRLQARDLG